MTRFGLFGLAVALVGCENEQVLLPRGEVYGVPNPPSLETPLQEDRYVQVPVPKVDVLWVVDNSCSMVEEQNKLSENFPLFMDYFLSSNLDYHIGVVSTDMLSESDKGRLQERSGYRYIDNTVTNAAALFSQMAVLGVNGDTDEKGIAATYAALELKRDGYNNGFLRDEATLSVIIISDENDYTNGNPITRPEFISWLRNLKASPDFVSFSSIVGPQTGCLTAEAGLDYLAVTNAVGGIKWSICKEDWAPVLEELGLQAAGLRREFFLSQIPVRQPNSVQVLVKDAGIVYNFHEAFDQDPEPADSWTFDEKRNSIRFVEYIPNPGAEVMIDYKVLAAEIGADQDSEPTEP